MTTRPYNAICAAAAALLLASGGGGCGSSSKAGGGGDGAVEHQTDGTGTGGSGTGAAGTTGSGGATGTGGMTGVGGLTGAGGTSGAAGHTGAAGSGGKTDGGSTGTGGSTGAGGTVGTDGGGPSGTQPIGSVCANTGNCSQTAGAAVCCGNTCLLTADCPMNQFVPCGAAPSYTCQLGKCCEATAAGQTMRYCTKNNGCAGKFIP